MKEDQKLVTVAEFDNSAEASLAKAALEDAGIESVILGEPIGSGLYPVFDTYVKVQVFEPDAERARQILEQISPPSDSEQEGNQ